MPKDRLKADASSNGNTSTNNITISQDDPEKIIRNDKFEVVDSFRHLSDSISHSGSCFKATVELERSGRISTICFQY